MKEILINGFTTGLPGLDEVIRGVAAGDNIVWKVDNMEDYRALVIPYAQAARADGRKLVYFRFASHDQLLDDDFGAEVFRFDPHHGFEPFINAIRQVIGEHGTGAHYVFDCLSELADIWCSDEMLGNFFMLACPYLYELETVTYFALAQKTHSSFALKPITETTQFMLDVFRHKEQLYIRPIKVQYRAGSVMNLIHRWSSDDTFEAVTESSAISEIMLSSGWTGLGEDRRFDFWKHMFAQAEAVVDAPDGANMQPRKFIFQRLVNMVLTREKEMLPLIKKYMRIEDILELRHRMVGVGRIGGKAVGMLVARAILRHDDEETSQLLEAHDSFYIGSDVYYTYLVRNGLWPYRAKQRDPNHFLENQEEIQQRFMEGDFTDYNLEQFDEMLDYFGWSPLVVRSSSLLEDSYGNMFAGQYESCFCVNQGSREERLKQLINAVRHIYASTMNKKALSYRARRGMLDQDEQMAVLVMRVSGSSHGPHFYPHLAGVGFSFNPYVWHESIDPKAGVIRLVFGLGTRAVDPADDDHTRIVALNAPTRRPESNFDQVMMRSQRRVDYIDLAKNELVSGWFHDLVKAEHNLPLDRVTTAERISGAGEKPRALTFDHVLTKSPFTEDMRRMLQALEEAYQNPVDIEFTCNLLEDNKYCINLVQCRPLQIQGLGQIEMPELDIKADDLIIEARGAVIGCSRMAEVDRFVYIMPSEFGKLTISERYEIARLIGEINRAKEENPPETVMLLGPGRWGTKSPELGIPVNFSEINKANILCEIVAMHENLVPDVSLGTHFLSELVENNMLYLALFPSQKHNYWCHRFF
ncbi:MAG: PEP/pyruvate-binding domain-containing protein, partial [Kiritimatiellales bacterium]|nr:PEP/pyruvate-binding domain-containing protein [Kiritimatiellales bacterium]